MINPDIEKITLIRESQFQLIEIDNITKIKNQNTLFKTTLLIIAIAVIVFSFKAINDRNKKEYN
jgi:hypothetical protein